VRGRPLRGALRAEAVFFDIDNTLYDFEGSVRKTLGRLAREFPGALSRYAIPDLEVRYWNANASIPQEVRLGLIRADLIAYRRATWLRFFEQERLPRDETLAGKLAVAWGRERHAEIRSSMFPGARATIEALQRRFVVGIISNGPSPIQRDKLLAMELASAFEDDLVLISGEFGADKPDPSIFEAAAKRAAVDPRACVMVGDSLENDMPAKRIGYTTVHFTGATLAGPAAAAAHQVWNPRPGPSPSNLSGGETWKPDHVAADYGTLAKLLR